MHAQSMTGYGKGMAGNFEVEVRSSNHRGLYIQVNAPAYLYPYEADIRKMVKQEFNRGRIDVNVSRQDGENMRLKLNRSLAREYYNALITLKNELSLSDHIGINILASQRDIFQFEEPEVQVSELYDALKAALQELKKARLEEGQYLIADIREKIDLLERHIAYIEDKRTEFVASAKERLYERLKEFLGDTRIEDTRLIQETAILIERSDIAEEIVRVRSHLGYIRDILDSGDTVGKKIDFIAQELNREINTIGSKTPDIEITTRVVEMKNELEKIREQAQNLQ